ncbi:MAG TPA: iron chelate uptake ABC transporter family permease subunit, partial [Gemmatimonadaceae bacterium]|nr:iron chelate uptake ABC transporter family permease subunit [Gemmatimonadaceae bacterium]
MTTRHWLLLVLAVLVAAVLGVSGGAVPIPPGDVSRALLGEGDATQVAIVQNLRLPRIALGLAVGAGLAVSGAALQTTLRNPLAEPYLLGVSGGAAAGAVAAVT